jgi:D-amino peptidase
MKVLIWADMEGTAGIEVWEQVRPGSELYQEGRRLMTGEVNAAVRGAKAAGATEIVVVDSHGAGGSAYRYKSLLPERLESGAEYVLGHLWGRYLEPLETGCDVALMTGGYAMAGTADGVLAHSVSADAWRNVWLNDTPVGSIGITAAICGTWAVPLAFVSGDAAACREATGLLGEHIATAQVKRGLSRYSARSLSHTDACTLIERQVERCLSEHSWPQPCVPSSPVSLTIEFSSPEEAAPYASSGVERSDRYTLVSRGATFWEAWDKIFPTG